MKIERLSANELEELLTNGSDEEIRGTIFELPSSGGRAEQPLFRHQVETLERLDKNRGVSGIIHLPTGAGKTRVAIEIAARRLRIDPAHRIVWTSYPRILIRQGIVRLVELASLFPAGVTFQWVEPNFRDDDLITRAHVTFMMRDDLTGLLEDVADGRVQDAPLVVAIGRRGVASGVTLVYDECHQLGARQLQSAWKKCDRKFSVLDPAGASANNRAQCDAAPCGRGTRPSEGEHFPGPRRCLGPTRVGNARARVCRQ